MFERLDPRDKELASLAIAVLSINPTTAHGQPKDRQLGQENLGGLAFMRLRIPQDEKASECQCQALTANSSASIPDAPGWRSLKRILRSGDLLLDHEGWLIALAAKSKVSDGVSAEDGSNRYLSGPSFQWPLRLWDLFPRAVCLTQENQSLARQSLDEERVFLAELDSFPSQHANSSL